MRRVAVFGNAGGGKSRLARQLADLIGLPLCNIDKLQFRAGGDPVPHDEYLASHAEIMRRDAWVIDGYGDPTTLWERLAVADTLVHVDLAVATHYWFVTKRFVGGLFVDPPGWPAGSPLWPSTRESFRVIPLCHRHLTPKYRAFVANSAATKRVHSLRSPAAMRRFLEEVRREMSER